VLLGLLDSANLSSRRPLFEQYDPLVQSRTVRRPQEADAAVLQLRHDGGQGAIAVSIDCNGRRVACDPYWGAVEAVLECAANLACVGAEPLGLTNCLNFGNPEKPHVAWQLSEAVRGLADACRALDVPVVGGNVSLYNESGGGPIYPTPVVGMVGKLPDPARAAPAGFSSEGDVIAFCGEYAPHLPGSELAKLQGEALPSELPARDLERTRAAHEAVRDAVRAGELSSAHDAAEGGLLVAIAESCMAGGIGATIDPWPDSEELLWLFGECPGGGFLVSGSPAAIERLSERTPLTRFGTVGGHSLRAGDRTRLEIPLEELRAASASLAAAFP
jgi:phosphoribosylformylglycinamidine synthase